MNFISKIILGFVVIAVFACLWFVLTQNNKGGSGFGCGGCRGGGCSGCGQSCAEHKEDQKKKP